jgi:hypothetical protein
VRLSLKDVPTQEDALMELARLVEKATVDPAIRRAANQIVGNCPARDDMCELNAIYEAVKYGCSAVPGLKKGVRYVSDARYADQFYAPQRLLQECANGACAGDCDDHAALVAALAACIGFRVGLRAYGPKNSKGYSHVYAVAYAPKRKSPDQQQTIGLDTTVPYAKVGWQPPKGRVMTAVID